MDHDERRGTDFLGWFYAPPHARHDSGVTWTRQVPDRLHRTGVFFDDLLGACVCQQLGRARPRRGPARPGHLPSQSLRRSHAATANRSDSRRRVTYF